MEISEVRREVQLFAMAMEAQLRANDFKGSWKKMSTSECIGRMRVEMRELEYECDSWNLPGHPPFGDRAKILKEAADVANFAMFTADCARALTDGS